MEKLFVYGTLCPGRSNAHMLESIGGEWLAGSVKGVLYESGWGAAAGFPAIQLDEQGATVPGYIFQSSQLSQHWPILDEFEAGYDRVPVTVNTEQGEQITAWVYQIQPA
ncbi:gamma-glutamylcyclotransferase [Pantoea sp. KPR_PJ]|uniref:gamma-glutamylcyclotransferase family protein n=1 Tax=Pantoea sp. KPR_PJ TaxID=2738375 RepID=UPI0035296DC0